MQTQDHSNSPAQTASVDAAIGLAVKSLRKEKKLSAVNLSSQSGVSASMISRIETGQVSPSLSSLNAIALALDVPLISLFQNTMEIADITHATPKTRLNSTRSAKGHKHCFSTLGYNKSDSLVFESFIMTLTQKQLDNLPVYVSGGVEFIYILEGEAIYQFGQDQYHLKKDHSLTFDAIMGHGFKKIITPEIKYICNVARPG